MATLYLVQHGKAKSKDEDPERPLNLQGRRETERIAELAVKLDLDIQEIWHSGKTRTEETAVIYGRALGLIGNITAVNGLNPTDDVNQIVDELAGENKPIMLVGHLPFMPRLVGQLVHRDPEKSTVEFHNSGIVCLVLDPEGWKVDWQLNPG